MFVTPREVRVYPGVETVLIYERALNQKWSGRSAFQDGSSDLLPWTARATAEVITRYSPAAKANPSKVNAKSFVSVRATLLNRPPTPSPSRIKPSSHQSLASSPLDFFAMRSTVVFAGFPCLYFSHGTS